MERVCGILTVLCSVCVLLNFQCFFLLGELQWCFSQVKGTIEEEITDGKSAVSAFECAAATPY